MQDAIPLYKKMEKKVELLNEFVQVTDEMSKAVASSNLLSGCGVQYSDLYSTLTHIREDFDLKHRHWEAILNSSAEWA